MSWVYGFIAYAHIPDDERRKMDKKAMKLRFVGYANCAKGYCLYDEEKKRILIHCDVIFNESNFDWKQEAEVSCSETEVTMETDGQKKVRSLSTALSEQVAESERLQGDMNMMSLLTC